VEQISKESKSSFMNISKSRTILGCPGTGIFELNVSMYRFLQIFRNGAGPVSEGKKEPLEASGKDPGPEVRHF